MNKFEGHFKGVYHVYEFDGRRCIEEFFFESFEGILPSKNHRTMTDEFHDSSYEDQFLELEEIEKITLPEFYFEILGNMTIEFYHYSWEYPNEVDSEMIITDYEIALLDEKTALAFNNFDDIRESRN